MRARLIETLLIAAVICGLWAFAPARAEERRLPVAPSVPPAAPAVQAPVPAVANQPTKPEEEVYTYESARSRDPFFSLISAAKAAEKKKKKLASPIEEYDVFQMKLIAVVRNSSRHALVRLPDGKHYTLKEGSVVGIHGGTVKRIQPDSIVVEEATTDARGRKHPKYITLKLREEEE